MAMFTLEKVLLDARSLVAHLKEREASADGLLSQTQDLSKKVDNMKMYQDNLNALTEMARQRPYAELAIGIFQENTEISDLDQENSELRQAVDEHQSAIELIMSRYRDEISKLVTANRLDHVRFSATHDHSMEVQKKVDEIYQMADVMWTALQADNSRAVSEAERLAQLRLENSTLRDLLTAGRHSLASDVASRHAQTDPDPLPVAPSTQPPVQPVGNDMSSSTATDFRDESDTSMTDSTVLEVSQHSSVCEITSTTAAVTDADNELALGKETVTSGVTESGISQEVVSCENNSICEAEQSSSDDVINNAELDNSRASPAGPPGDHLSPSDSPAS